MHFQSHSFESLDEVFSKARNGLLASFSIRKIAPRKSARRLSSAPPLRNFRNFCCRELDAELILLVRRWMIWDWLRVALIATGFVSSVRAISIALPRSDR